MRRSFLCILFLLLALPALAGARPDFLLRVERLSDFSRQDLLSEKYDVAAEMSACLLVRGDKADIARLEASGHKVAILDSDPLAWDYYTVGLRPDSDREALKKVGAVLHTEENWVLLRIVPGTDLAPLYEAKVFVSPIGRESLKDPRYPDELVTRRAEDRLAAIPLVQQMVNSVNTTQVDNTWSTIVANAPSGTRYSTNSGCTDAANWVLGQFNSFGLQSRNITHTSGYAPNTEGQITGAVNPSVIYIIESHLDDTAGSASTTPAPGADDNGSGSVTVVEAARILSCYAFRNTVRFLTVTGEEQGLYGSTAYANNAYAAGENIQGVINYDMPGWAGDGLPSSGENLDLNYDSNSAALGAFYAQCATDYATGLPVDAFLCPSLTASDHYGFWQNGYKAVCGITDNEGYCSHNGNYPYYHTVNDTIANCGAKAFFYAAVKTTVAAIAALGDPFKITLDKASYGCTVPVQVIVGDRDLNTNASTTQTVTVDIWSTRESTHESLVLTEDGVNSMIFKGTMPLSMGAPVHGDGLLSVNSGDTITARYVDALDCNGAANVTYDATGTVSGDCAPPVISNVQVTNLTDSTATITWTTDEAANSRVTYGTAAPPATNRDDLSNYVTSHSVTVSGLTACTSYVFSVTSADAVGNGATDNNGGSYYSFTTYGLSAAFGPEDVETGTDGWTLTGQWHADTCKAHGGTTAFKAGSTTCPGTYNASTTSDLTWGSNINLGAAGHGYHLRFWEYYQSESGWDYCRPQISTDGGTTWTTLGTQYAGTGTTWAQKDFDLAAYTGSTVRIRFEFSSDGSQNYEGWYVDDIQISKAQACGAALEYGSHSFADVCSGTGAGSADGVLDAGEDATVQVTLSNTGSSSATGVSATLSSSTTGVTITDNSATYPDIASGGTGASQANHYAVHIDSSVACGTTLNFTLAMTSAQGSWSDTFTMTVGATTPGSSTPINEAFTTGDPPAGWTRVNGGTGTQQWTTSNPGARTAPAGMTAPFEVIDSDFDGSGATQDDSLITPAFDCTGATAVTLTFDTFFNWYSSSDYAYIDVSANNGSTWTTHTTWTADVGSSTTASHQVLNITALAGTASQVKVRFRYVASYGWYWLVDNVRVDVTGAGSCVQNVCTGTSCVSPTGLTNSTAVDLDACADTGVRVQWTADPTNWGGTGTRTYDVLRNGVAVQSGIAYGTTSYTDTTGVNGTSYTYTVRYNNGCGQNATTAGASASDAVGAPGAPAITGFSDPDGCVQGGVQITYTGGSGALSHDLYRDGSSVVTGYASGATYNPGDTASHSYVVRAVNGACTTDSGTQAGADGASAPPTVSNLMLSKSGTDLSIAWDLLGVTVDRYEVMRASAPEGPFTTEVGRTSGIVNGITVVLADQPDGSFYLVRAVIGSCSGSLY